MPLKSLAYGATAVRYKTKNIRGMNPKTKLAYIIAFNFYAVEMSDLW